MRFAAILALCAAPVMAQDMPSYIHTRTDTMSIAPLGADEAIVEYYNHPAGLSNNGVYSVAVKVSDTMTIAVDIHVTVNVNSGNKERIEVVPHGSFQALPPIADLTDGETGRFRVVKAMY